MLTTLGHGGRLKWDMVDLEHGGYGGPRGMSQVGHGGLETRWIWWAMGDVSSGTWWTWNMVDMMGHRGRLKWDMVDWGGGGGGVGGVENRTPP